MDYMHTLLVASRNPGKVSEFRTLLAPLWVDKAPADVEYPAEDQDSYSKHALAKARACYEQTGVPSIGDDSGFVVDALSSFHQGVPGIYSARYGGPGLTDEERVEYLLCKMETQWNKSARFVCVVAYVNGDTEQTFRGVCRGHVTDQPKGTNGFGYDSIFIPLEDAMQRTFAQMPDAEKHVLSHRARACYSVKNWVMAP